MTEQPQEPEEAPVPVQEGPDPKDWPAAAHRLWDALLNVEHITRVQAALNGRVPPEHREQQQEARDFLTAAADAQRAELALAVLHTYGLKLPDPPEEAVLAPEVTGGFRGDGNGPGDRDHLRPVRD